MPFYTTNKLGQMREVSPEMRDILIAQKRKRPEDFQASPNTKDKPYTPGELNYIKERTRKVGYSGLDQRQQAILQSQWPMSKEAQVSTFEDFVKLADSRAGVDAGAAKATERIMAGDDAQAVVNQLQDGSLNAPRTPRDLAAIASTEGQAAPATLYPEANMVGKLQALGLESGGFPQRLKTLGRDMINMPGRAVRTFGGLLSEGLGDLIGEGEADYVGAAKSFADPSGIMAEPSMSLAMALPMAAPEALATMLPFRGVPAIGRAVAEYPKAAALLAYPAQGLMQGYGLKAIDQALGGRMDLEAPQTDAAAQAGTIVPRMNALEVGASLAGGGAGGLGRWLEHAGTRAVPGVEALADMAQKSQKLRSGMMGSEAKIDALGALLDRSGALRMRGLHGYSDEMTRRGAGLANPIVEELAPLTSKYQDDIAAASVEGLSEMQRPALGGGLPQWRDPVDRRGEYINALGGIGIGDDAAKSALPYSREMLRADMMREAKRAKALGNKAFRGLNEDEIANKIDAVIKTLPGINAQGWALSEMPGVLGSLNSVAYDKWLSTGRAASQELGQIGRGAIAPKYWESAAFDPFQSADMDLARRSFGEAAAINELLTSAATGGMKQRGMNIVGRLGQALGMDFAVPLVTRQVGKQMTKAGQAAGNAGRESTR